MVQNVRTLLTLVYFLSVALFRDNVEGNPNGGVPKGSLSLPPILGRKRVRHLVDSDSEDEEGDNPLSNKGGERSDTALSSPEGKTNNLLTEHDQVRYNY